MQDYLSKCIESLVISNNELFTQLEVIIVNDGSKDNSIHIAKEYKKRFPDVIVIIDKKNGNYGSCVNAALQVATGTYIKILDADDYFDTKAFEHYLCILQELDVDLVLNRVNTVDLTGKVTAEWHYPIKENEIVNYWDYIENYGWLNMHMVAYKTVKIREINYRQTEGISYTDQEWIHLPITTVETTFAIPVHLYQYLNGREGQTMNVMAEKLDDITTMLCSLGRIWQQYEGPRHKKQFLFDKFVNQTWRRYDEYGRGFIYRDKDFKKFDTVMLKEFPILKQHVDNITVNKLGIKLPVIKMWRHHLWKLYILACKVDTVFS